MADLTYNKRPTDRREGRRLRSLPKYTLLSPYVLRRRSEAQWMLSDAMEVNGIEQWLREKRGEGWSKLGILHLIVAAYVRTVTMRPGINRFVSSRRLFARNDIQVVLSVKRSDAADAPSTSLKVSFSPTDTVFDVYRRITDATDKVQADLQMTDLEAIENRLDKLPRFALRIAMSIIRALDYMDWLPRKWLDASPFHASLEVVDLGSLGFIPVDPRIPDFGTIPAAFSFGAKRKVLEPGPEGRAVERHFVDYRIVCDTRIADTHYFISALRCLKYFLKNPALLELPPERIEDDVN